MSAIDWLDDVITAPLEPPPRPTIDEPAVTRGIQSETIQVTPLDAPNRDAVGLLPRSVTGFPADLWGPSSVDTLMLRMAPISQADLLPATRRLLFTLLLAEVDAPLGSDRSGRFLLHRVEKLTRFGAIEQAHAMLARATVETPSQFDAWFDLSLLLGREQEACDLLSTEASLTSSYATRIFCLTRASDWPAAALSFGTARVLGQLTQADEALLLRYLDADLDDTAPPLSVPVRPSPLTYRLFEAIGEPLPTSTLPLAFAHADLRSNSGWRLQIEAAERLTRAGALPANQLLGLYTERSPAASGVFWDRVAAMQNLDRALSASDPAAIADTLGPAWAAARAARLEHVFADLFADRLRIAAPPNASGDIILRAVLLTEDYELVAGADPRDSAEIAFLKAVARGDVGTLNGPTPRTAAVADAFRADTLPERFRRMAEQREIGAALLLAIDLLGSGKRGDLVKVTEALALFRGFGLEDVARRAALELLILDERG